MKKCYIEEIERLYNEIDDVETFVSEAEKRGITFDYSEVEVFSKDESWTIFETEEEIPSMDYPTVKCRYGFEIHKKGGNIIENGALYSL